MNQTTAVLSNSKSLYLLLGLFIFVSGSVFAQGKLNWGDIPKTHLLMEECPFEKEAKAAVLIDRGKVVFDYTQGKTSIKLHKHKRIKIFDRSASDQGDMKIQYYYKYAVTNIKAQVIDKDGNITELSKKQIFDEKINDYYKSKNFALPNVQPGSILEIKYTLTSPYIAELFEWYFQEDIPVIRSELEVTIPSKYDYTFLFQGAQVPEKRDMGNKTYAFTMNDVPSLQEEAYITSMNNYRNRIRFQLTKYRPNYELPVTYMSTWEEINKELNTNQNLGKRLKSKKAIKRIAGLYQLSEPGIDKMSDLEKVESIYRYVQSQMTWDKYYGITTKENLNQVIESGKGSAQEINMILTVLLNANNIESNLVVMPTRTSGKSLELYPFADQFNYAISSAKIGDEFVFLDASDNMNPMGVMPVRALNSRGFMLNDDKGKWVDIPIKQDKEITFFKGSIDTDGSLIGTWSKKLNAYSGADAKKKYGLYGEDYLSNRLKEKFAEVDISNTQSEGLLEESKKVKYSVDVNIPEACTVANDFLYLKPILHTSFDENPFKMKERKYPIDMPYPFAEQFILSLEIPESMEVEELPEDVNFSLEDRSGVFTYTSKVMGESIMINSSLNFKRNSFTPDEYQAIKTLFEKIVSKNNEQIVFKLK